MSMRNRNKKGFLATCTKSIDAITGICTIYDKNNHVRAFVNEKEKTITLREFGYEYDTQLIRDLFWDYKLKGVI